MREIGSWSAPEPRPGPTDIGLKKLINEVQEDQWNGATNIERATATRAELFSRFRFQLALEGLLLRNSRSAM
jgi:hypothetical protein